MTTALLLDFTGPLFAAGTTSLIALLPNHIPFHDGYHCTLRSPFLLASGGVKGYLARAAVGATYTLASSLSYSWSVMIVKLVYQTFCSSSLNINCDWIVNNVIYTNHYQR